MTKTKIVLLSVVLFVSGCNDYSTLTPKSLMDMADKSCARVGSRVRYVMVDGPFINSEYRLMVAKCEDGSQFTDGPEWKMSEPIQFSERF